MQKKTKSVWRGISIGLAIVLTSLSVFVLVMHKQALNEKAWTEALEQSGIYATIADIIEGKVSDSLTAFEKELINQLVSLGDPEKGEILRKTASVILGATVEKQTPLLVADISSRIQLEKILQNTTEERIRRDVAWFEGNDEAVRAFNYIPTTDELEELANSDLVDVFSAITGEILGFDQLPACTTDAQIVLNKTRIAANNARDVTCTNEEIAVLLKERTDEVAPEKLLVAVETKTKQEIEKRSKLSAAIADFKEASVALAAFKDQAIAAREAYWAVHDAASFVLLLSVGFAVLAIVLSENRKRFQTLVAIYFFSGLTIVILAFFYSLIVSHIIFGQIPFDQIKPGTSFLAPREAASLMGSVQSAASHKVKSLAHADFWVGGWMMALSALAWGIMWLTKNWDVVKEKTNKTFSKRDEQNL